MRNGASGITKLWEQITPDEAVHSIYDINLDKLRDNGIRLLLTDLDNTLVSWRNSDVPPELLEWSVRVQNLGFVLCLLSNGGQDRVQRFAAQVDLPYLARAGKPRAKAYQKTMERFAVSAKQTAMIGDQLFTDVRGARRLGVYAILVHPLYPREWWGTRVVRLVEKAAFYFLKRRAAKRKNLRKGE
ncbi:YqeG family HAD IIIA-type phosphatase [Alicyclobacillaceae bacterium I2511]|nr:YqeG family HAD IIIA-type phosphatase [Alicyclobacillaceae bacterium I2511]